MGEEVNVQINLADTINETAQNIARDLSGIDSLSGKKVAENVIAFTGLAGGCGASTILANVAYLMAKKHYSVLVIDTNVMYPTQHIYFSIKQQLERDDFVSFLTGEKKLGDCIVHKNGIGVLSSNNRNIIDAVAVEDKLASDNYTEFLERACTLFDLVLIDCQNKVESEIVNTSFYRCDKLYCVMDENIECVSNYTRLKNNLQITGIDYTKIRVIFNKRTNIFYPESVFKELDIALISILPFDTAIIESGLGSKIFVKDGVSSSKNANLFAKRISLLANIIIKEGGGETE